MAVPVVLAASFLSQAVVLLAPAVVLLARPQQVVLLAMVPPSRPMPCSSLQIDSVRTENGLRSCLRGLSK